MKITERITQLVLARKPALTVRNVKRDIATTCGISYEAVRQWFAGDTENIKNDNLVALSEGYDTTVDWLLGGKGEPPRRKAVPSAVPASTAAEQVQKMLEKHGKGLPEESRQKIAQAVEESLVERPSAQSNVVDADFSRFKARKGEISIPQYDIRGSLGHGQVPAEYVEFVRNIVVNAAELEKTGVEFTSPANLQLITGWGHSMRGTINDKDPLFIDRGITEFVGEGVYFFTWLGHMFIKRVQLLDAEHFLLVSDNKEFEPMKARMDDLIIHAKAVIVWNVKRL